MRRVFVQSFLSYDNTKKGDSPVAAHRLSSIDVD